MKKYIRNILLFFAFVVVVDLAFGKICQYMYTHTKGGVIKSRYYACKESTEDVLIFGSSRAKHHYVPDIIEDSLHMTCYNTGEDGNGIILSYGFLKMVTARYQPKLIIYDVSGFDIYEDDNSKYLDLMKPYYREPGIDGIFWTVDPKTRLMMLSNMYRYNTHFLRILGDYLHPIRNFKGGYSPMYGTMDYESETKPIEEKPVDLVKLHYFQSFIALAQANHIQLICCISPVYKSNQTEEYYAPIIDLCQRYGVPFINYLSDEEISNDKEYFKNATHMNDTGARTYTSKIIHKIKNIHP